jgi:two-component system, OmpR family, phosphate regulon sensor histidine kinase PhoR
MKRRFILINFIVVVTSLLLFLIVSALVVNHTNQRNMEAEIKNYLSIVSEEYDGTNMEKVALNITKANNKIRITFISYDGTVLYDTVSGTEENHLSRPEIENLGTVYHRYSSTAKENMFYVATLEENGDNKVYIRVSMPETSITNLTNTLVWSGIGTIVIITIISTIVISATTNKVVEPLNQEVEKLSSIVGKSPGYNGNDIERLSFQIDRTRDLIEDKISTIEAEKKKTDYIIENIKQGLIIIDGSGSIILMNKTASKIFNISYENLEDKNYFTSFIDNNLKNSIDSARLNGVSSKVEFSKGNNSYNISLSPLDASFVLNDNHHGVIMFIFDVTDSKRLEKTKAEFFANASHELKSPLTSILGYQQMINEGIVEDKEEIADYTAKTIKEAKRMNQIISEMLELSRLEVNKTDNKVDLTPSLIIDDILNALGPSISDKGIKVTKLYQDFDIKMSNDDFYHLMRNLIENAVKYNKIGGDIIIDVNCKDRTISVKDTGIGINDSDQERIFERFFRVDKAKSKENGGTGLGLAIVKHICLNNDILINVKSSLGIGSEFKLTFK